MERGTAFRQGDMDPTLLEKLKQVVLNVRVNQSRGFYICTLCDAADLPYEKITPSYGKAGWRVSHSIIKIVSWRWIPVGGRRRGFGGGWPIRRVRGAAST